MVMKKKYNNLDRWLDEKLVVWSHVPKEKSNSAMT